MAASSAAAPADPSTGWPQRLPSLDGLRGLAILMVMAHQLPGFEIGADNRLLGYIHALLNAGWTGVTLFFVLSGFLITRLLMDDDGRPHALRDFYVRRVLRIVPLYGLLLLAIFVLWPAVATLPPLLASDQPLWYVLFLSNVSGPMHWSADALPNLWSVAVEEQFYLLWPWLVRGRTPAQVLRLSLAVAMAAMLFRAGLAMGGVDSELIYHSTPTRIDALALGAALAAATRNAGWQAGFVRHRQRMAWTAIGLALFGMVVFRGYPRVSVLSQAIGYVWITAIFAVGLAAAIGTDLARGSAPGGPLRGAVLRSFGRHSYAIYLFHKPLHDFLGLPLLDRLGLARTLPLGLAYAVALTALLWLAGWLSYHLVERSCLALAPRRSLHRA